MADKTFNIHEWFCDVVELTEHLTDIGRLAYWQGTEAMLELVRLVLRNGEEVRV